MSNMSYCRFQNTARDLDDCQSALEDFLAGEGGRLSRDELAAAKRLIATCTNIVMLMAETVDRSPDEIPSGAFERDVAQALERTQSEIERENEPL